MKQPDIPAGSEAEDEPAGPATDPLAANGSAWPAADPPADPAAPASAWPADHPATPASACPAADPPDPPTAPASAWPAADAPAAVTSAWPAADAPAAVTSAWATPEPPVNGSAWPAAGPAAAGPPATEQVPAAGPAAGDLFGSPPTDPFLRISAGPPGPSPAEGDQPPEQHRRVPAARLWLTVAAALLGVAGLAISLVGVADQVLPRRFTAAEQQQIISWQVASRWRAWPAGKIFPASVSYQLPSTLLGAGSGLTVAARRVGIAPQARCSAAVDPALARLLGKRGCEAVLRATYTDSTGSFVVTVGIAIMHGSAGSILADHRLPAGVRPVPFPGTLAAQFGGRQRQISGTGGYGPYLILYTAGYADGRQRERVASNPYASSELKDLGTGLAQGVGTVLGAPPPAPRCPGAPGC